MGPRAIREARVLVSKRWFWTSLVAAWVISVGVETALILTENYVLSIVVALIAVVGSIVQLRRASVPSIEISWRRSRAISHSKSPAKASIDPNRPLIGMVSEGPYEGRYVQVVMSETEPFLTFVLGPAAGATTICRRRRADEAIGVSGERLEPASIRYLPQGALSDELWRRNFYSLRASPKYFGLKL
jgi:hypothetical protein